MSQFIEMFTDKGYPLTMIKSFADVSTGGTPSKAHPEYWNGDKPWVSAEDMKSKYVYDTCEKVTEAGYATCKIIPVDTLMYVCRGSIGVMAINKIECATNQSICRATCHNNVCNVEFLYHALMYQRDNIKKKGTGTSFKSLNQTTFSELEIELPPYDEQMKFVTIAEQADKSGFDELKSQFIEMFGNERIEDCKWQNLPMGHVFEISSSRRVLKEQWTSDGVPFLRVRDMVDLAQGKELNNEAFISEKYYNKLSDDDGKVREGDIIISATSTIGKCYLIKKGDRFYYKDADILRLRKQKEINCSYFMYAFNMPTIAMQVEESIGKTTVGHFLISKAQNIKIPMPPIELQVQFESILHQADKSGSVLQYRIAC